MIQSFKLKESEAKGKWRREWEASVSTDHLLQSEFCEEKSQDGAQAHYGVLSLFTLEYPQFTDSTKQCGIVYNVISQECNVPPSLTLSFKLVWWTQFSSKDNMIFGQSGGIRNMILFMLDTCVIFLNIQSWVYAGLQQSFYYSWKMTACRVIMFRLVIMQFTIAYVEGNMKF